jgi:hypothetical protein
MSSNLRFTRKYPNFQDKKLKIKRTQIQRSNQNIYAMIIIIDLNNIVNCISFKAFQIPYVSDTQTR